MLALSGLAMTSEGFFILRLSVIALWYSLVAVAVIATILAEGNKEDKVPSFPYSGLKSCPLNRPNKKHP